MIDNIYPIAYLGGSGGSFLSSWLNNAAYGYKIIIDNNNGNVHQTAIRKGWGVMHEHVTLQKIKNLHPVEKQFIACHIIDNNLLLSNFTKITKIVFEPDDVLEIAISFCSKNHHWWDLDRKLAVNKRIKWTKKFNEQVFNLLPETNRCINVSWKKLLHHNSTELIDQLSNFYLINPNNFNIPVLNIWRKLTLRNITRAANINFSDSDGNLTPDPRL